MAVWALSCAGLPHRFDPKQARDFAQQDMGALPHEPLSAVLLIPKNARLHYANAPSRASPSLAEDNYLHLYDESYPGPARLFLKWGHATYRLEIKTDRGLLDRPFEADLEPGCRYEIEIEETSTDVTWALIRLSEQSYHELYPRQRTR